MARILVVLFLVAGLAAGGWFAWSRVGSGSAGPGHATEQPPAPTPPPDPLDGPLRDALVHVRAGRSTEAVALLTPLLRTGHVSPRFDELKAIVGELNLADFLAAKEGAEKIVHDVVSGDTISAISAKHGVSGELIVRVNNLPGVNLRIGQQLNIPPGEFSAVVSIGAKTAAVFRGTRFFKEYMLNAVSLPRGVKTGDRLEVREKVAWSGGERVPFGVPAYVGSAKWIVLNAPGTAFYADQSEDARDVNPPGAGFAMEPADVSELFLLFSMGSIVQIDF